jgi:hypothetical protein
MTEVAALPRPTPRTPDDPTTPTVAEIAGVLRRHFSSDQAFIFLFDFSTVSPEFRSAAMDHVVPLVGVPR